MNFFEDRKIKKIARDEDIKAPDKYLKSVERTLNDLKNNEEKIKPIWSNIRKFNYAIAMAMLMFVLLTNVSPKFAYAMQELPIIGDIVKVITIRNYFDKDGNSEIEMEIPNIKNDNNSQSQTNENVNEDMDKALDATDENEALPYWKDLQKYTSAKGDAPYCWLVNANHVYLAADGFDFGNPVVQPHGGRIFDNVNEWSWK